MATARWRGARTLTEGPESPDWDFQASKISCTRDFSGPYAEALSNRPAYGQFMTDLNDEQLLVINVKVKRQPGGKGRLIVILEKEVKALDASQDSKIPPRYEIEWQQIERRIQAHPIYDVGGARELSSGDRIALQLWETESDYELRADFKFTSSSGSPMSLTLNAQNAAQKLLKGTDSFIEFVPVLRRTTLLRGLHTAAPCGIRLLAAQLPADVLPFAPTGYQWMKNADRGTQSGKFGQHERIEEWIGSKKIDEDLYA